jgi:DNA-binding NtrC family response regulator
VSDAGGNTTQKTDGGDFLEVVSGALVQLSEDGQPAKAPVPIGREPCNVGRGGQCQVVVRDGRMSTSHCELTAAPEGVCITDLQSLNGTWVNGVRLKAGHSIFLTANGQLRCGHTWFDVQVTGREQVPLSGAHSFGALVGGSAVMRELYAKLGRLAPSDLNILITGETGTGKELVAQAIHDASGRRDKPYVVFNCGTISPGLAESALFGHAKGAFTGASSALRSPFLQAEGGTIFFDEIGELPVDLQPKLLRALEAREIQAVGSSKVERIDVRVIAATWRDLRVETNEQRFRNDLYYRFAGAVVETPPLRKHREDIPDIIKSLLARDPDPRARSAFSRITKPAMDRLMRYDWPGNVRELRSALKLAIASSDDAGPLDFADALGGRVPLSDHASAAQSFAARMEQVERDYWTQLLTETAGNLSEIARRSGLSRQAVRVHLDQLGLRDSKQGG